MVSKKRVEKEKYLSLIFIFLSLIILFFPKDFKLKIFLFPNSLLLKPLIITKQFLLSLKNYQKERNYLYELFLKQNLILAQLKKISNIPSFSIESLENSYIIRRANIISRDNSLKKYLVVDKGLKDSIMVNFPVISLKGVVGKVIACSDRISVVETFYSPYSKISAKIQRNNYLTCVVCKQDVLYLDYLDETVDIMENDTIISTEIGGIFPEGLKIGVVKKVEKKTTGILNVTIEPCVDLLKIDDVYILQRREQKIKRDELEILLKQLELKLPEIKFVK
ncbi:MAG: rod shape-determining protein MreC [candidate division WOR-3 bacterium]|nr:rod shape-determining protein MreC [candidate division WOR-3 bacterium]MCX7836581.1 rod shape-determining protein MreC [candidate division WOR-3 bacterium]